MMRSNKGYHPVRTRPKTIGKQHVTNVLSDELAGLIGSEYDASRGIYGAPKVFMALKAKGARTSRKRVARIMPGHGWRGVTRGRVRKPAGEKRAGRTESADDLVKRDFTAKGPNQARFADITYVRTHQGRLYLAVVMDASPGMIVGWSMGPRITAELADDALRMAIARRHPARGCIHHSDHGSQYTSLLLGRTMGEYGIRPSMGSISSPWNNAATESLMGVIKAECIHARTFDSREQAALEIFEYIECFYNRVRIHSAIGWMSPADFEAKMVEEAAEAA